MMSPSPKIYAGEILPLITSSRSLEKTIKAMHAGSMKINVVIA